jgi:predicted nucleic acid-binding protein
MFLIDTVTLSELRKRERDPAVVAWFEGQRTTELFLSVISIGEIERGIAQQRATDPRFAESLAAWLDRVLALYGERVLAFDVQTARRWGTLSAALGNASATALEHGLTVVTRNASDFRSTGVPVLNPFKPRAADRRS